MKNIVAICYFSLFAFALTMPLVTYAKAQKGGAEQVSLAKEQLADKIKGGWAGKTIGCTYGGPIEFLFNGTMIFPSKPFCKRHKQLQDQNHIILYNKHPTQKQRYDYHSSDDCLPLPPEKSASTLL